MHQMTRTLAFVIAASASVIGAVLAHVMTRPQAPTDLAHTLIGQPFYPSFNDPTKATAIRVAAWNPNSNQVEEFEVRYDRGQWRIPSHNNYPADGKVQLARAAASAVGIVRGSLSVKSPDTATLERLGVVDPLDDTQTQGAGISGTRITLYEGDQIVADYVIGHRFGEVAAPPDDAGVDSENAGKQAKEGRFYVRRADEKQIYLADVRIDVSTRFRDWIDNNLLDLSQADLRSIIVNRYTVDEEKGRRTNSDISELTRTAASEPWKLEGLDESKERVKTGVVAAMARAIDALQIVGVRKKPEVLATLFTTGQVDVLQLLAAQNDLRRHGFILTNQDLLSVEGEVLAGTREGIQYILRFGNVFVGSDLDVEVGQANSETPAGETATGESTAASPTDATQPEEANPSDPATEGTNNSSPKRNRYVIVEALFDPTLLGPEPTAPVKPTPPAEPTPATDTPATATPTESPAAAPTAPATETPATETPASTATPAGTDSGCDDTPPVITPAIFPATAPPAERTKTAADLYQEALQQYERDVETYQAQRKDYEQRLIDGQKRVDQLNKKFSEWYYVISADIYEDLRVSRAQLVEPYEAEAEATPTTPEATTTPAASPETAAPEATPPAAADAANTETTPPAATPAATTPPATDTPATPAGAASDPPTSEQPVAEQPTPEQPATEPPATTPENQ